MIRMRKLHLQIQQSSHQPTMVRKWTKYHQWVQLYLEETQEKINKQQMAKRSTFPHTLKVANREILERKRILYTKWWRSRSRTMSITTRWMSLIKLTTCNHLASTWTIKQQEEGQILTSLRKGLCSLRTCSLAKTSPKQISLTPKSRKTLTQS